MPTTWDMGASTFDTTSSQVHAAREERWFVETTWGWAVLRYAEATALLRDRRFRQGNARWPEQNGVPDGPLPRWWSETLLSLEGEDHDRVRRLLLPAFKRSAIEAMRPGFTALAEELLDDVEARAEERGDRRVELIGEVAEPYAARIICRILGIDEDHWRQVAHWADDLGAAFTTDVAAAVPRIEAALTGLSSYVEETVAARRADPGDDLVSALVAATGPGGLSERELSVALVFLAFAGMETTRNQVGLAVRTLLAEGVEEPGDQWRLLAARPDLGAAAVEEVMRLAPTVTWVTREAVEDVVLPGPPELRVPAGGVVQVLSHAAGTDPRAVASPGLDLEAAARGERPPHTGFGAGIHHCLGHYVARVDMAVLLPTIARRWPDLAPDGPGEWLPVSGNTGALSFPLRF